MRTNIKGDIGEALVMAKLLKEGYWVSKPFGDDCPYDIIADDKNGNIRRIQVKYSTPKDSKIRCDLTSSGTFYKDQHIDWILVVDGDSEEIYRVDLSDMTTETVMYLRLEPTKNGQVAGIKFAKDYLI
jgi:outer membrane lipoprotein-sorting protein